jgi:transcriptional regulator with XRE-family HTH domain
LNQRKSMPQFQNYTKATEVTDTYVELIDALVARRNELGLSQERLALEIGCTISLIHKWEQYKRVPSGFMLTCWLDALGVKIKVCAYSD